MNNYIFDLDGTLIDSSKEVFYCMEKAFEISNYPLDKTKLTFDIIGPPLADIIKNLAPNLRDEKKINEIVENFRVAYDNEQEDSSEIYDGVFEVLEYLKNNGCRLFVATFKPHLPTIRVMSQFQLIKYFDDIYTIDKFGENITKTEMIDMIIKKYKLSKTDTCMIGDTVNDMKAATSNGIKAIGALWGYGRDKAPLKNSSNIVLKTIGELCQK